MAPVGLKIGAGFKTRYVSEKEMLESLQAEAVSQGFDEPRAIMLANCGKNIYSLDCQYAGEIITLLQDICKAPAEKGEAYAIMLLRRIAGQTPRLRSNEAMRMRMGAARAAAERRRRRDNTGPRGPGPAAS